MEKINFTSNQAVYEYVLYMIAGSYFVKATCTTDLTERNLRLHYKEQKPSTQFEIEDYCIKFMDKFEKRLGAEFFERNVIVRLVRFRCNQPISIVFFCGGMELTLSAFYAKKKTIIRYRIKTVAA